jgi:hypothetical protein
MKFVIGCGILGSALDNLRAIAFAIYHWTSMDKLKSKRG